jgi:hypothetical protein
MVASQVPFRVSSVTFTVSSLGGSLMLLSSSPHALSVKAATKRLAHNQKFIFLILLKFIVRVIDIAKLRKIYIAGIVELQKIVAKLQNNSPKIAKTGKNIC